METESLKATLISTSDLGGGAARAAFRLHCGLIDAGVDSRMVVRDKRSDLDSVTSVEAGLSGLRQRVHRLQDAWQMRRLVRYRLRKKLEVFSFPHTSFRIPGGDNTTADVINLHWITQMVDLPTFFSSVPSSIPIVWTLHDMNAFTGGCHYTGHCDRWKSSCGSCPALGSTSEDDPSRRNFATKQDVFSGIPNDQLTIVTPSRWLGACVEQSTLLSGFRREIIPYGIDTTVFRPVPASDLRTRNHVADNDIVILFLTDRGDSPRKGLDLLLQSLAHLKDRSRIVLSVVGPHMPDNFPADIRTIRLGYLDSDAALSETYSAADLFVIPSREDNLPNVVLEALACGTPVVGFDIGGVPDMVRPGVTGFVATPDSPESLAAEMQKLISDPSGRRVMSANCRRVAEEDYSLQRQAESYIKLFENLLSR